MPLMDEKTLHAFAAWCKEEDIPWPGTDSPLGRCWVASRITPAPAMPRPTDEELLRFWYSRVDIVLTRKDEEDVFSLLRAVNNSPCVARQWSSSVCTRGVKGCEEHHG